MHVVVHRLLTQLLPAISRVMPVITGNSKLIITGSHHPSLCLWPHHTRNCLHGPPPASCAPFSSAPSTSAHANSGSHAAEPSPSEPSSGPPPAPSTPSTSPRSPPNREEVLLRRWARILDRYEAQGGITPPHWDHTHPLPRPPADPHASEVSHTDPSQTPPLPQDHLREVLRVFGARGQGGLVPEQLSERLVTFYTRVLRSQDRAWFFRLICSEMGLNVKDVSRSLEVWQSAVSRAHAGGLIPGEAVQRAADQLNNSTRPMYAQLLLPISQLEGGIAFLVGLRADLAVVIQQQPAYSVPLRALSEHLRQALANWFTLGLLELHRISWGSCSGELLDKIMRYEAVHPMSGWSDLQRRLSPADRRVFAFMHPCLPGEPLVILHTALLDQPVHAMTQLLTPMPGSTGSSSTGSSTVSGTGSTQGSTSAAAAVTVQGGTPPAAAAAPSVAVFYSISSTQPGLSGVDLGHFLIKKVAKMVQAEFPSVQLLVTLSPVPNFRSWLTSRLSYEASQTHAQAPRGSLGTGGGGGSSSGSDGSGSGSSGGGTGGGGSGSSGSGSGSGSGTDAGTLLTEAEGTTLLQAAWGMPSELRSRLLAAVGVDAAGADAGVAAAEAAAVALQPPQRAMLLSAWLEGDAWRHCQDGQLFRGLLMRLAARYLVRERRRNLALDPVANFHLRNGAQLWRVNWGADTSERGMHQSFGIMVNYRYDLDLVHQRNHEYLVAHRVDAAPEVEALAGS